MGRLKAKKLEPVKLKGRQQNGPEKETKQDQRLKKKEIRKHLNRAKDYGTSEEKDFSLSLLAIRLKIKYMDGDGNCLFRSIADQLTGECSNHHGIRSLVIEYIEKRKEHFSLFMEDDETFEDYIDRMKTFGEWGGHQELYAASQCLHVNIIVHQCSSNSPRFILTCDDATRDINLSYHGECHYNSVNSVTEHSESLNFSDMKRSLSQLDDAPNSALENEVLRALPWSSSSDQIKLALQLCSNDVDAAVELLMLNPDGIEDKPEVLDKEEKVDTVSVAPHLNSVGTSSSQVSSHQNVSNEVIAAVEGTDNSNPADDPSKVVQRDTVVKTVRKKERVLKRVSVATVSKKQSRKDRKDKESGATQSVPKVVDRASVRRPVCSDGVREVFL